MGTSMKQAIMNELNSITDSELAAKINAAASAAQKSGFASTGGSASAAVNTNISSAITNETKTTIENIYAQNLKNNFNSETVNECIGKTTQKNETVIAGNEIGGSATIGCVQTNSLEQVQECKQLAEAANKTLIETANQLGIKVVAENTTTVESDSSASSSAEQISTGPIQDLGNAISGVVGSMTGLLGLASLGVAAPFIIYSCCIVCCLLICCSSSLMVARSGSNSGSTGGGNSDSDSFNYVGTLGINMISDILSDSSPLF
jgi:hypothetical protein